MPINLEYSEKLMNLPPYIFAEIAAMKRKQRQNNVDLISMDVGDPDIPTPQLIVDALKEEVQKPENHKYPTRQGEPDFLEAVAKWYVKRFKVEVDPRDQVINLLGTSQTLEICIR